MFTIVEGTESCSSSIESHQLPVAFAFDLGESFDYLLTIVVKRCFISVLPFVACSPGQSLAEDEGTGQGRQHVVAAVGVVGVGGHVRGRHGESHRDLGVVVKGRATEIETGAVVIDDVRRDHLRQRVGTVGLIAVLPTVASSVTAMATATATAA
jgi:hypothetical protein